MKRALAMGVMVAALSPVLAISGCSTDVGDLEGRLTALPTVSGAYVWTTTSGSPTNRGYSVRLYVSEDPGDGLAELVDDALRTVWTQSTFKPTNGIAIQIALGERPENPQPLEQSVDLNLEDVVHEIPWGDRPNVSTGSSGTNLGVHPDALVLRYGEWE